jgi:hypothetical protein
VRLCYRKNVARVQRLVGKSDPSVVFANAGL